MSEPKRYAMSWATDENEFVYVSPKEQANGNWVKWDDYARLKDEVERLTKAGDAMADWFFDFDLLVQRWNAAKEDKGHA